MSLAEDLWFLLLTALNAWNWRWNRCPWFHPYGRRRPGQRARPATRWRAGV